MGQGAGGGPKPKTLTKDQAAQVEALAAYLTKDQIADYLSIARNTFTAICERQPEVGERYARGKAKAIGTVAKGLIRQAIEDDNIQAQMFYLKTQAGWMEKSQTEITGADGAALSFVIRDMTKDA